MAEDRPSRTLDKFVLRLPDGMRDRIQQQAANNGRSMNAEIIDILTQALGSQRSVEWRALRQEYLTTEAMRREAYDRMRHWGERASEIRNEMRRLRGETDDSSPDE